MSLAICHWILYKCALGNDTKMVGNLMCLIQYLIVLNTKAAVLKKYYDKINKIKDKDIAKISKAMDKFV